MKKSTLIIVLIAALLLILLMSSCNNGNTECTHRYENWSTTREATCTGTGVQSRICQKCGYTQSEKIEALGHLIVFDPGVEATCTRDGLTDGKHCSVCNEIIIKQELIIARHSIVIDEEAKAATCTEAGWSERSHCSVCSAVLSEKKTIEAKGHIEVTNSAKTATCTESGLSEGKYCSVCKVVIVPQNIIPSTGHKTIVDKAVSATCISTGLTEGSHCSICNTVLVKQNTTAKTGHNAIVDKAVSATCSSTGLTEGSHCSYCNTVLVKQSSVAKLSSHAYVSGVCKYCKHKDPNYVQTFKAGEKWVVEGQFELTINSVERHNICNNSYGNNISATTAVIINYTYKNLGSGKFEIDKWCFEVYDSNGVEGDRLSFAIWCDHGSETQSVINGGSCTAKLPVALVNNGNSLTLFVEKDNQKATFVINVTNPPTESEKPKEDKLNGCTIKVDTVLPKTIDYYTYNGSKESSCSVTEVSFEVSGDDLYIYFTGRKTYDSRGSGQSDSCKIGWKLYDSNNYVIASGTARTLSIAMNEGFMKTQSTAYNCITSGGSYRLVILNVNE